MCVVEAIDTELDQAGGKQVKEFFQWFGRDAFGAGVIHIEGAAAPVFRVWPWVERRHIDAKLHFLEPGRQFFLDLFFEVFVAGKVHAAFLALFLEHGAVGHLPFDVADKDPLPFCTQAPLGGMARGLPSPYLFKQGPVGQRQVLVHPLARIVGKQELHGVAEDVTEVDVDRARGPVIVDVGIEIHAGIEEHLQGRKACLMNRKSLVRDDRVVNESG